MIEPETSPDRNLLIAGIGAFAGDPAAVEAFFSGLPGDFEPNLACSTPFARLSGHRD